MMIPAGLIKDLAYNKEVLYGFLSGIGAIGIPAFGGLWRLGKLTLKVQSLEKSILKYSDDINKMGSSLHAEISIIKQDQVRHDEAIKFLKEKS